MRLNRNTRIGLALLGVAALLYIAYLAFGRRAVVTPPIVENPANNGLRPISAPSGGMVAVAREDIPERSIVTSGMLTTELLPSDMAQGDYVMEAPNQIAGYVTQRALLRGERLRRSDLVGHISNVGISAAVRPGLRAMVVPILNKATLHDLVQVGDYVDVIASFEQQESRTIVQNVRVLAVDVFGKYQQKIAPRGDYRADAPLAPDAANPPSPAGATGAPTNGTPPQAGAPAAPTPTPTPAPVTSSAPPAKPEPSLTLEVSPEQATSLSLAQASSAPLDFILRPHIPEAVPVGGASRVVPGTATVTRVIAITKAQIAPYAQARKDAGRSAATSGAGTHTAASSGGSSKGGGNGGSSGPRGGGSAPPPVIKFPKDRGVLPPGGIDGLSTIKEPETYKIPIYGDGKVIREDTVLKPPS